MRSEFQFIRNIKDRFDLGFVGDDCAVLAKDQVSDLLITADLLIEGIDFRLEWAKPGDIGHKALAVSLSDVAAMGGTPTSALISLGVPKGLWKSEFVDEFYSGWHALAERFGVELVGGDVSSADELVIDSIVLGEVPKGKAIRRSGAKAGDLIYVSGSLGGSAAGLNILEKPKDSQKWDDEAAELVARQLRPIPKVVLAKQLRKLGIVTAMIDVSDGLSSDLVHICEASGLGATLKADDLPLDSNLSAIGGSRDEFLNLVLNGGEDFELLFTVVPDCVDLLTDLPVTQIGEVKDLDRVEIEIDGLSKPLEPQGFRHF
jgi:thiamine-monophosphate kinase